jgi:hypothetical protein
MAHYWPEQPHKIGFAWDLDRFAPELSWESEVERMAGIEPALSAWEADVLPLNYIRRRRRS